MKPFSAAYPYLESRKCLFPALPNLQSLQDVPLDTVWIKLGVEANAKSQKASLSAYYATAGSRPELLYLLPERSIPSTIRSKLNYNRSRSARLLDLICARMGLSFSDLVNSCSAKSPNGVGEMTNLILDEIEGHLRHMVDNLPYSLHGSDDLLLAASSLMSMTETVIERVLRILLRHPQGRDLIALLTPVEPNTIISRYLSDENVELKQIGSSFDNKISRCNSLHDLVLGEGSEIVGTLLDNPTAVFSRILEPSIDKLRHLNDSLYSAVPDEEGYELIKSSIVKLDEIAPTFSLNEITRAINNIGTFIEGIQIPSLSDHEEKLDKLLSDKNYGEMAKVAAEADKIRADAVELYLRVDTFIESMCVKPEVEAIGVVENVDKLKARISWLESQLRSTDTSAEAAPKPSDSMIRLMQGEGSVHDVVVAIGEMYPHVKFTELAVNNARDSQYSKPDKLFYALHCLCGKYYADIKAGKPDGTARDAIGSVYRANESEITMSDRVLRAMREHIIDGNKEVVEQHLTLGVRRSPTATIQVYFKIIGDTMHIAYIGPHLEISSS